MEFNEYHGEDLERGLYLVTYTECNCDIEDYQLLYYRPNEDGAKKGFYLDMDCTLENEVTKEFKWDIKKYLFLPNLLREDGKYLKLDSYDDVFGGLKKGC